MDISKNTIRSTLLLVLLAGSLMVSDAMGQQVGIAAWDAPLTPAFPQRVAEDPSGQMVSPASELTSPSNDIRQQIGLATYAEPVIRADDDNAAIDGPAIDGSAIDGSAVPNFSDLLNGQAGQATSRDGLLGSIKVALLLAVLSLAPAIVLMTTCYVRVVVVLTLLRQAFGGQQLPPMQVITALSLFMTMLIMAPVWNQVKTEAIDPYTRAESPISWDEAWQRGIEPIKHFMCCQITASGNEDSVAVFYKHLPDAGSPPSSIEQVPVNVLLPAFLISELKVAFLLGFQIFLPFLILDLVVSSVTVSSGMLMLPPTMVSFPLKLILFVMVDGWNLVVGMLLQSFVPYG
jgi:flagellar biosynthetic protein FliP